MYTSTSTPPTEPSALHAPRFALSRYHFEMRQRVLLAWSGGKDSTLALAALLADPDVEVVGLLTAVTAVYDRISIHGVGRRFDASLLADLPEDVDPCGERGEFHTCVVAGPIFRGRIPIQIGERVLREARFEYCDLIHPID